MQLSIIRHAAAGSRSDWDDDDRLRPLTQKGLGQARQLVDTLSGVELARVLSSPYLRCRQTVEPLVAARHIELEVEARLGEGRLDLPLSLVEELLSAGESVAICSHGDVIPAVIEVLSRRDQLEVGRPILCAKGSVWQLEFDGGICQQATYWPPN